MSERAILDMSPAAIATSDDHAAIPASCPAANSNFNLALEWDRPLGLVDLLGRIAEALSE